MSFLNISRFQHHPWQCWHTKYQHDLQVHINNPLLWHTSHYNKPITLAHFPRDKQESVHVYLTLTTGEILGWRVLAAAASVGAWRSDRPCVAGRSFTSRLHFVLSTSYTHTTPAVINHSFLHPHPADVNTRQRLGKNRKTRMFHASTWHRLGIRLLASILVIPLFPHIFCCPKCFAPFLLLEQATAWHTFTPAPCWRRNTRWLGEITLVLSWRATTRTRLWAAAKGRSA